MKRLITALMCLLMCACEAPGDFYTVAIDPNLPAEDQASIREAILAWRYALDGRLTIYEHPGPCTNSGYEACFWASNSAYAGSIASIPDPLAVTLRNFHNQHSDVYVALDQIAVDKLDASQLTQTMAHELGHSMALQHSNPGTLMCWELSCAPPTITCGDLAQWLDLRGDLSDTDQLPQCPGGGTYALSGR